MSEFSEADHERAQRAGQQAMAKTARVKPERKPHRGWRFVFGWLALTQFVAVVIAVVDLFHHVSLDTATIGYVISWPVVIAPRWAGLLAALGAFIVLLLLVWGALGGGRDGGRVRPSA